MIGVKNNVANVAIVAIVAIVAALLGVVALQQPTINVADHGSKIESTPSTTVEVTATRGRK